jgi:hypothetical protein
VRRAFLGPAAGLAVLDVASFLTGVALALPFATGDALVLAFFAAGLAAAFLAGVFLAAGCGVGCDCVWQCKTSSKWGRVASNSPLSCHQPSHAAL